MTVLRTLAAHLLTLEPFAYFVMAIAMWASPIVGMIALPLVIPIFAARWIVHRRLWTRTPLDVPLIALALIAVINWQTAPYPVSITTLSPLLFGIVLVFGIIEIARARGINGLLWVMMLVLLYFCITGAMTTAWFMDKSWQFVGIINALPMWDTSGLPVYIGYNPNTLGMLLTWLIPLAVCAAAVAKPRSALRWAALIGFGLAICLLYIGQARIAIVGVLAALTVLDLWIVPADKRRVIAMLAIATAAVFEIVIAAQLNVDSADRVDQQERDESSLTARLVLWEKAVEIVIDYPLTGVGSNRFASSVVNRAYNIPMWGERPPIHAHNLVFQTLVDLGIPGLVALGGVYAAAASMLRQVWARNGRNGLRPYTMIAAGITCGLIAYGVAATFAVITFWHHFAFVFWLMIGAVGALYVQTRESGTAING